MFRPGKTGSLHKGIEQVVDARQHLLDMMVATNENNEFGYATWPDMKNVFSAVIAFEDATDGNPETYRQHLLDQYRSNRECVNPRCEFDTGVYVLPNFIGSLNGFVASSAGQNLAERRYWAVRSVQGGRNLALLWLLCRNYRQALEDRPAPASISSFER